MSRAPIFQVMLAYQNIPLSEGEISAQALGDITLEPYDLDLDTAKYEQTLTLWPENNRISGSLTYNTDLFRSETANLFVEHFIRFCENAFAEPEQSLSHIDVLSEAERHQQLVLWNQTEYPYQAERIEYSVVKQIKRSPEVIAISQGQSTLSYRELGEASDSIAATLMTRGVSKSDYVGVYCFGSIQNS